MLHRRVGRRSVCTDPCHLSDIISVCSGQLLFSISSVTLWSGLAPRVFIKL